MDGRRTKNDTCLLAVELCLCVTLTGLFAAPYPDRFRTVLWEHGGAAGWNSDPRQRWYHYANYTEPPEVPLIWSQRLTDSNLAVALLSLAVALARIAMRAGGQLRPSFAATYDAILGILWAYCVASQMSADMTDPEHPSPYPWYLTRGCGAGGGTATVRGACRVSQAGFVASLLVAALYGGRLASAVVRGGSELVKRWRRRHNYQLTTDKEEQAGGDRDDEEDQMASEKERYLYKEALSPVLAFFPEDDR